MTLAPGVAGRRVFVALGSNVPSHVGDRLATLAAALRHMDEVSGVRVARISSAWETEPIGPPQPRYLNAAAELRTSLPAREVLHHALDVERLLGRDRTAEARWGPRPIDIDLLLDGESLHDLPGLTVPHPRLAERVFVLVPLEEIAPDAVEPRSGETIRSLLARVPDAVRAGSIVRFDAVPFFPRFRCDGSLPGVDP
ncbi:MAG: 2-amino-4-hydroxy-6-hydroxymethyldihydropteridine diphosphokinase [Phycisphaerae bacterium]|nr:2-amino-4-hydroxy-6-hydroxymethyldihydropteridine diphosphokinase [Phycisphaerae bacterium]